jgi:hypothetical protein
MAVDLGSASPTVYASVSAEASVNTFCRICATKSSRHLFSIFSPEGELWDIAEKIGRCLPIIVCIIGGIYCDYWNLTYLQFVTAPPISKLSSFYIFN